MPVDFQFVNFFIIKSKRIYFTLIDQITLLKIIEKASIKLIPISFSVISYSFFSNLFLTAKYH